VIASGSKLLFSAEFNSDIEPDPLTDIPRNPHQQVEECAAPVTA